MTVTITAPFWMINRTGRHLTYRQTGDPEGVKSECIHSFIPNEVTPVPFCFPINKSKRHVVVKIDHSDWSGPVNIDTVGIQGVIAIPCRDTVSPTELAITIEFSTDRLSKIVTLSPRFVIFNHTQSDIICRASCDTVLLCVPAGGRLALWPSQLPRDALMDAVQATIGRTSAMEHELQIVMDDMSSDPCSFPYDAVDINSHKHIVKL